MSTLNSENYYCSYGWTRTIEKDGVEETVAYIYYTDTLWTKYISDPLKEEPYQFSIGNSVMVDYGKLGGAIESKENISAVYYLIGDYSDLARMTEEEFEKAARMQFCFGRSRAAVIYRELRTELD